MRKNWAIAVALSIVLCSFTACNTASVNTEIDSDGSYEFVYTESTAEEEQTSSEEQTGEMKKVAKDGAGMQTEDSSVSTRIPMEGG
ncbi:MAG: hypothetical protein II748_03020, partial [Clostridia bacterium]|nr:hypothetical protein [Clostridia bacterium]